MVELLIDTEDVMDDGFDPIFVLLEYSDSMGELDCYELKDTKSTNSSKLLMIVVWITKQTNRIVHLILCYRKDLLYAMKIRMSLLN
jgi:hypothetical protein